MDGLKASGTYPALAILKLLSPHQRYSLRNTCCRPVVEATTDRPTDQAHTLHPRQPEMPGFCRDCRQRRAERVCQATRVVELLALTGVPTNDGIGEHAHTYGIGREKGEETTVRSVVNMQRADEGHDDQDEAVPNTLPIYLYLVRLEHTSHTRKAICEADRL